MTEKEKAEAYDKAIERAKKLYGNGITEEIFLELKEDDDERIRKNCIHFLELQKQHHAATFEIEECIDWLEKQGKKPVDKIEPRFKVGDWVVFIKSKNVYKIEKIENYEYTLRHILGGSLCLSFSNEKLIREWTIQDGKDGDVLAAHECYVVFKEIDGLNIKCHCTYHYLGLNPSFYINTLQNKDAFLPATKEQRDTLMKAMNDAGYKWNIEKKELKKKKVE